MARDLAGTLWGGFRRHRRRIRGGDGETVLGFDGYPFLEDLTGVGWYAWHMLERFGRSEGIRVNLYARTFFPAEEGSPLVFRLDGLPGVRFRHHGVPPGILPNRAVWLLMGEQVLTPLFILFDGNDLFFAPNFFPPPSFHVAGRLAAAVHDCAFALHPEFIHEETLRNLLRHLPPALHRSGVVLSVSRNTKNDIRAVFKVDGRRVHVVLNGVAAPPEPQMGSLLPFEPFILFVGTLEPRKNVLSLVRAFERLKAEGSPLHLVLIGKTGWKNAPLMEAMASSPWAAAVHHLSYLPAGEVTAYYRKAFCFVFPSHYEGFGLPVLEAMAQGCPVVATANSSLPEVGGDACLYVRPDPESIAGGIRRLQGDAAMRTALVEKGYRQVQKFSWDRCAEETLAILKEAAL